MGKKKVLGPVPTEAEDEDEFQQELRALELINQSENAGDAPVLNRNLTQVFSFFFLLLFFEPFFITFIPISLLYSLFPFISFLFALFFFLLLFFILCTISRPAESKKKFLGV